MYQTGASNKSSIKISNDGLNETCNEDRSSLRLEIFATSECRMHGIFFTEYIIYIIWMV